jgi:hypothetical protein
VMTCDSCCSFSFSSSAAMSWLFLVLDELFHWLMLQIHIDECNAYVVTLNVNVICANIPYTLHLIE